MAEAKRKSDEELRKKQEEEARRKAEEEQRKKKEEAAVHGYDLTIKKKSRAKAA